MKPPIAAAPTSTRYATAQVRRAVPPAWAPPNGPSESANCVKPPVSAVSSLRPSWYRPSNGRIHELTVAIRSSRSELSASPIWPSSPATSPAPTYRKIAIPFAVADRKTDPSSERPTTTTTAAASSTAGVTSRSGHQSPVVPVITTAIPKTTST